MRKRKRVGLERKVGVEDEEEDEEREEDEAANERAACKRVIDRWNQNSSFI